MLPTQKRIQSIDILRCIAALGVIAVHAGEMPDFIYGATIGAISSATKATGWMGVDMFFVLSGYLVSGLLFSEYQKNGSIDVKRFYIRRGFKIYPSFYIFIAVSFVGSLLFSAKVDIGEYVAEVFFLHNYFGFWHHTWSIDVEEHFYLILPVLLFAMYHWAKAAPNPFKAFPWLFACVAVWVLAQRLLFEWATVPDDKGLYQLKVMTHFRIDALLFGVLLSYYRHFEPSKLEFVKRNARASLLFAAMLILIAAYAGNRYFMPSIQSTTLYVAFGLILIAALDSEKFNNFGESRFGGFLAYLGQRSYSIYLWHFMVLDCVEYIFSLMKPFDGITLLTNVVYVVLSLVLGVALAELIEFPFLKLRDAVTKPKPVIAPV